MVRSSADANAVYVAVIGDLVGSRAVARRADVQRKVLQVLDTANRGFRPASRFDITGGDEFKALWQAADAQHAVRACVSIGDDLHPVDVRFGIGLGRLQAGTPNDPVGRLDGPCFHNARRALDDGKREDRWMSVKGFQGPDKESMDLLVNSAFQLIGRLRSEWTDRQREYVRAVEQHETQRAAAEQLQAAPSSLSASLKAARYHEMKRLTDSLMMELEFQLRLAAEHDRQGGG